MLKRDLSYELFSRELQALDELFSREPDYTAKREPLPGNTVSKPKPKSDPKPPLDKDPSKITFFGPFKGKEPLIGSKAGQ